MIERNLRSVNEGYFQPKIPVVHWEIMRHNGDLKSPKMTGGVCEIILSLLYRAMKKRLL